MKYETLKAEQFPVFVRGLIKNPAPCNLNLLMREDDKILIAKGRNALPELPSKFVPVETYHNGGPIVGFKDSVCLVSFHREENPLPWREDLQKFLLSKGLNAKKTRNDITIDGFKVSGYSSQHFKNDIFYSTFFAAFNVNISDVQIVCKKNIVKVPKGLDEFGITRSDVLKALDVE